MIARPQWRRRAARRRGQSRRDDTAAAPRPRRANTEFTHLTAGGRVL